MGIHKPLRAVMFSYDLLRLLFLAASVTLFSVVETAEGSFFPYLAYLSSNALFPLICFFLFLKPLEYRNYIPLYMTGKTIGAVLFYAWAVLTLPIDTGFVTRENYYQYMILLGGIFFISLGDILSIFGVWVLNKSPRTEAPESGQNGGL